MPAAIRKHANLMLSRLPEAARVALKSNAAQAGRWAGIHWNRVEAHLYDLRHGTDTTGSTPGSALDIPDAAKQHVTGFQSVNERHLRTVLEHLPFPAGSRFVDIGCGKGKALLVAADYDFVDGAIGVELAGSLCRVAEANVQSWHARRGSSKPIRIVHADATTIDYDPEANIFFLNNPFSWPLMAAMIDNIARCLGERTDPAWLLYGNPVHREELAADRRLDLVREFRFFGPGRNIRAYRFRRHGA